MTKSHIRDFFEDKANNSWKRVIFSTITGYFDLGINMYTSALTYYLIFAIFPCLILISSLLAFLDLPNVLSSEFVISIIPEDIKNLMESTLNHMQYTYNNSWFTFGLLFSMWFVWRAMKHLLLILNIIYQVDGFKYQWLPILISGITLIVFIPIYLCILLIGQNFFDFVNLFIPLTENFVYLWEIFRFIPLTLGIFIMFAGAYTISTKRKISKKFILPGAILGTLVWVLFSYCFVFYVDKMGRYSLVYGSIGTVIAFLVWLNASVLAILMGAVFNQALREEFQ